MGSRSGLFSKVPQSLLILTLFLAVRPLVAHGAPQDVFTGVSLSVDSPTVPPGGLLQTQVFITEPKPILKGKQGMKLNGSLLPALASPLGAFRDAALFSTGGDVSGVAVTNAAGTQFFFSSPLETFGTSIDTPVMTMSYPVRATAAAGQAVNLTLDSKSSLWLDPSGKQYPVELKSGVMTVGGTLSVSDVVPGAGKPPAGTLISVKGVGFQQDAEVDFGEGHVQTSTWVNSNLIQVTLRDPIEIRGQRVRVKNHETNEESVYFPFQRTTPLGKSTHALIASSFPLFPQTALSLGYFRPTLHATVFSGIALQNLNSTSVTATLQLYSKTGVLLSTQTQVMGKNSSIARDLVELFPGVSPADGTRLKVTSGKAIQMLGLLGDDGSGTVLPVPASSTP
jgi:hypothetical protein